MKIQVNSDKTIAVDAEPDPALSKAKYAAFLAGSPLGLPAWRSISATSTIPRPRGANPTSAVWSRCAPREPDP